MVARRALAEGSGNVWGRRGQWQCLSPAPRGVWVGGSLRAEPEAAAATSLGESALEGQCFGVLMGDLGVVCKGAGGTHWQRCEAQAVGKGWQRCWSECG